MSATLCCNGRSVLEHVVLFVKKIQVFNQNVRRDLHEEIKLIAPMLECACELAELTKHTRTDADYTE